MLDQARSAGALDLCLPLGGMHGIAVPASFLVSTVTVDVAQPEVASTDPEVTSLKIATMLAARMPRGEVREMPAGIAVRSRQANAAAGHQGGPALVRTTTRTVLAGRSVRSGWLDRWP